MAEAEDVLGIMIFAVVLILVAAVMFFAQRYKRCPPDQIMVIYGRTERTADGRPKPHPRPSMEVPHWYGL